MSRGFGRSALGRRDGEDDFTRPCQPDSKAGVEESFGFGQDDLEEGFVAPRLLPEAGWDDEVMAEEIFGPVLPVVAYEDESQLLKRLATLDNPLAIYCFSKRENFISKVTRRLPSGSLCVNDTMKQFAQLKLPLGGVGKADWADTVAASGSSR